METEEIQSSVEEIHQRHRLERKDLQAKITAMKKTIPKNDKKKKKEVTDQINKFESEIAERHRLELSSYESNGVVEAEEDIKEPANESGDLIADDEEVEVETKNPKLTRAQRRRNKKENEDKERDKRIMEQEKVNRKGPRTTELNTINEMLTKEGLRIHNVPADGNCLYCSIEHQLEISGREVMEVTELRKLTADFIRSNKDDFLPFMCNDSDDLVDDAQFEKYCRDVASTKLWGGQLELRALSNILQCPIKIIQASGPPTIQGEQFTGAPLTITYHRHLYRLGEHYNSTSVLPVGDNSEEL